MPLDLIRLASVLTYRINRTIEAGKSTLLKTIVGTVPVIGSYIRLGGTEHF